MVRLYTVLGEGSNVKYGIREPSLLRDLGVVLSPLHRIDIRHIFVTEQEKK